MNQNIQNDSGEFIGLPEEIFKFKPAKSENFAHTIELDSLDEPQNIIETIRCIVIQVKNLFHGEESEERYIEIVSD